MASSSQQYAQQNSAGSSGYGQYQQQIRYSTPPIIGSQNQLSSSQPVASSPLSIQSPMMPSSSIIQTPQQQQPSSVQSIQSPVMMNSYQQQHSSGGGSSNIGIPHSPMPPSNQHYQPIQSPMPYYSTQTQSPMPPSQYNLHSPMAPSYQQQHTSGQSQYSQIQSPMSSSSSNHPSQQQQFSQHQIQSPRQQHINSPMPQSNSSINSPMMQTQQQQQNTGSQHIQSPLMNNNQYPFIQSPHHNSAINSPMSVPSSTSQQQQHIQNSLNNSNTSQHLVHNTNVNSPMNNLGGTMSNNQGQYNTHQNSFNVGSNINGYTTQSSFEQRNENMDQYHYQQQQQLKQQQHQQMIQQQQQLQQQREREQRERDYQLQQQIQREKEQRERELEKQKEEQRKRFLVELEFVQCLANPNYLHFLAKQGMFENASFKNYLKYLLYWKRPEYVRFIKYPQCLFFLELIQQEEIHESIKNSNCISFMSQQQLMHWKYYLRNREANKSTNETEDENIEIQQEEDVNDVIPGQKIVAADKIKKEQIVEESPILIKKNIIIDSKSKHVESLVQQLEKTSGVISNSLKVTSSDSSTKSVHVNGVKSQPKLLPRPQSPKSSSSISNHQLHSVSDRFEFNNKTDNLNSGSLNRKKSISKKVPMSDEDGTRLLGNEIVGCSAISANNSSSSIHNMNSKNNVANLSSNHSVSKKSSSNKKTSSQSSSMSASQQNSTSKSSKIVTSSKTYDKHILAGNSPNYSSSLSNSASSSYYPSSSSVPSSSPSNPLKRQNSSSSLKSSSKQQVARTNSTNSLNSK